MRFNPLVAAVVGTVAIASVPALVKDAEHGGGEARETHHSYQVTQSPQLGAALPHSGNNEARIHFGQSDHPDNSQEQASDSSTVLTNWIQALSAFAVALFTFFLWRLQSQQVGLTASAVDEAAKSASHASRAAQAAVDQHRAWLKVGNLSVSEVKLEKAENRDGKPDYLSATISISIQNVGGTPATNIVWQPSIWAIGMLTNFDDWSALWKEASGAYAERAKAFGEYGFVMFPKDKSGTLVYGLNTLTWPVARSLHIPSVGEDERFRLMGVVTVLYRITSGDEAMTTVPFMVHVGERGFETKERLRNPKGPALRVTRIEGAERAT